MALANSRLQFLENSFRRTGNVENKFATETLVPRYISATHFVFEGVAQPLRRRPFWTRCVRDGHIRVLLRGEHRRESLL
jgi:hypothetical protein